MTRVQFWILATTAAVVSMPMLWRLFSRALTVGDRIQLFGGYEDPPPWLQGRTSIEGIVLAFLDDKSGRQAVVVKLNEPITFETLSSDRVVLRLRYADARWRRSETVHVELCRPAESLSSETATSEPRWIESHASYRVLRRLRAG
jgi:hypothetical protein